MKGSPRKIVDGSLSDIITQYKQAPDFRRLGDRARREYAFHLDLLAEKWGPHPVNSIERKHILRLRDKHGETPARANKIVSVLRILLTFAVNRDYRRDNPAKEIEKLKMGPGHSPWPDEAIERFLETAPPMMALALKLGLYTGQRQGDVLAMSWHDYDSEWIQVVQSKTGTKLSIPVHSALREALDGQERVSPIILTTETGRPFTGSNFRHHFGKAQKVAGLVVKRLHPAPPGGRADQPLLLGQRSHPFHGALEQLFFVQPFFEFKSWGMKLVSRLRSSHVWSPFRISLKYNADG